MPEMNKKQPRHTTELLVETYKVLNEDDIARILDIVESAKQDMNKELMIVPMVHSTEGVYFVLKTY